MRGQSLRVRASSPSVARLPRIAKGRRPEFYEDPAIDQLFAIVTALTGEISVLFDRLDTVERLLADARVLSMDAIEAYVPDASSAALRVERRDELLRRVFAVLEVYAATAGAARSGGAARSVGNARSAGTARSSRTAQSGGAARLAGTVRSVGTAQSAGAARKATAARKAAPAS